MESVYEPQRGPGLHRQNEGIKTTAAALMGPAIIQDRRNQMDTFTAFFVGMGAGLALGIIFSAILAAIK